MRGRLLMPRACGYDLSESWISFSQKVRQRETKTPRVSDGAEQAT